jgi:hypothetical protein
MEPCGLYPSLEQKLGPRWNTGETTTSVRCESHLIRLLMNRIEHDSIFVESGCFVQIAQLAQHLTARSPQPP